MKSRSCFTPYKRTYESSVDAYRVFRNLLESGHPPDDWNQLLSQAELEGDRQQRVFNPLGE